MVAALLWLGLLLGVRHALEPDHLAAVGSLAAGNGRTLDLVRVGAAWGIGHAVVLTLAGATIVAAGANIPPAVAALLECVAGAVLAWLGAGVLRRLFARHHARAPYAAPPTRSSWTRALAIGALHGGEGSGAVVLLALPALRSTAAVCAYLALFGVGSILAMVACSLALAVPLKAAHRLAWSSFAVQLIVGGTSIVVGGSMIWRSLGRSPH